MTTKSKEKSQTGRPTKYREEYNEQARKLCLLGATDSDLAEFFEVNVDSIHEWKKVHTAFSDSIKSGKSQADSDVADRLYQRAMGYEHKDVDIRVVEGQIVQTEIMKHYPPDSTAAIFWLKNRNSKRWRDKHEVAHSGSVARDLTDEQLAAKIAEKMAKKGK